MSNMAAVTVPKSDQLNADDLISGPRTITVTKVDVRPGTEQPVSVHYEGGDGRPYKPCKSMCRIMVAAWGADANAYGGRSMTLYRDPSVKWGGVEIGGIRISHLTDIDRQMVVALTATKGSRKPYTVQPLSAPPRRPSRSSLIAGAEAAAADGLASYEAFFTGLSPDEKKVLLADGEHKRLKEVALKATAASAPPETPAPDTEVAAEKRGHADALAGASRRAVPTQYRSDDLLVEAWERGFDRASAEADSGGGA
jgi:hypothetical protein